MITIINSRLVTQGRYLTGILLFVPSSDDNTVNSVFPVSIIIIIYVSIMLQFYYYLAY